ncbi:hypothetical protein FSP39_018549 [Pinctada imbricata]|uniref:C2H2-type domain-containing protein n=1 Tax=Pinctada imbricata TaxID=66713 RepID=A0AA88XJI2_PINIB|nr:hypothetical protein FSP39_018549 [Pinctada imbricata]
MNVSIVTTRREALKFSRSTRQSTQRRSRLSVRSVTTGVGTEWIYIITRRNTWRRKSSSCPHKGCNFITKWKKNISHHVKSHNTTRPFVCHICSMTFKRGQTLKNHLFRHNDDKPKKCDECGFRCKSNYELRMHKLKHSDVRPFPCTFPGCQQRCKVKSDLVKHMRIHTKERNVLCPLCGKGFKSLSDCNKHQKRHSDIRPYGCDICGKFFRFIQGLKQHLRNHQGIKPFQCDVCGHLFSNKSNKDNHMKTHNYDERPYRCPICPYGAKSKDHLLAHIGTMHGHSYAFFCELCKKPFQRYFQLVTHHSRMHTKAEMNKFMSSIGVNMEEAQKEIKVEMVEEGLMTREQIGHMQVTLQQQQNSMDAEEGDEEHMADWGSEHGGTEQSTENVREENTESTYSDNTANSIPGEPQDADNEVDDTATARDQFMEDQSEKSSDGKSSEEGSIPLGQVIKQEPREHVNVSATLAIYDGFRLPLFTRGFEFNPDKSGKKPRCWFMEMDNMHEDIKWHQERYFSRIGTYEAKRARVAEMKRIYDETGEMVRIDGRKGARKRKKRFEHLESDDDLEDILAEICDDMPSQQITEKPIEENEHLEVSAVKKPKGRPPKSKDKEDLAGKAGSPKKRGRPPRPKVAEESEKAIEIRPDGNVDGDGVLDIPNEEMVGEKAGSSKEQAKKKNCKTKLLTQTNVVSAKKKKVVKTETNIKRKGNLKEETHSVKNKKQSKSKTYTSGKQSSTNKGTGVKMPKVTNQKKGKVSTQKKKQTVSKTTEDAKKDSAKIIRKVPPIRLKLQKKNKKRIWKCETSPKKLTKGSAKKTVKIAAKPTAKKGKQKSSSKKSTSRKKSQTNGFVIDWETEEQVGGPSDSNVYVENDFNGTGIKVEISDEVQDNYLGPEYRANDSCAEEESKDNIPKPTASFYCDDVILMKNSRESLKVLQNPPSLSMLGIENSSSRLGTVTHVEEDENSETKELELNDIVMGSSSKVCVYRNPEISDLGDFMKIHSEDLIQDICVAQEINSDIKAEPI